MKNIYELINEFKKKSFGNKTQPTNTHIEEVQEDESSSLRSRIVDNAQRPYISVKITEEEILNDLNQGRDE